MRAAGGAQQWGGRERAAQPRPSAPGLSIPPACAPPTALLTGRAARGGEDGLPPAARILEVVHLAVAAAGRGRAKRGGAGELVCKEQGWAGRAGEKACRTKAGRAGRGAVEGRADGQAWGSESRQESGSETAGRPGQHRVCCMRAGRGAVHALLRPSHQRRGVGHRNAREQSRRRLEGARAKFLKGALGGAEVPRRLARGGACGSARQVRAGT